MGYSPDCFALISINQQRNETNELKRKSGNDDIVFNLKWNSRYII